MRLNFEKAQNLAVAINNSHAEEMLIQQNSTWETTFNDFSNILKRKASTHDEYDDTWLDEFLKETRIQEMNRESIQLNVDGIGLVRFFPPKDKNISLDAQAVFARGLDTARAVLEIIKHGNSARPFCQQDIIQALTVFQKEIASCGDNLGKAKKCLKKFNGAMRSLLIETKIVEPKKAEKSINFVRDFLWKQTWQAESFCTQALNPKEANGGYSVRLATPIEVKSNDAVNDIKIHHLKSVKYGDWFAQFIDNYKDDLLRLSTTPMSRISYNPANAYDSSNIYVDKIGKVKQVINGTHVAITEPYQNTNKSDKFQGTKIIHESLIVGENFSRLNNLVKDQLEQWKGLSNSPIEIPILHQTLIADGVLPGPLSFFIPDQKKSDSMLDNKEKANALVRKELENYKFYFTEKDGLIKTEPSAEIPDNAREIKFTILETNHCVNQHHKYSNIRSQTVTDSRHLVEMAAGRLEVLKEKNLSPAIQEHLTTIIQFLKSSDYGMTPYKGREKEVKAAVTTLTAHFQKEAKCKSLGISSQTGSNIALLIQTATNLKCANHEGFVKAGQRIINNSVLGKLPFLGPIIRFTSWLVLQAAKIITIAPAAREVFEWVKHNDTRRRTVETSVNEALLAELLGERLGGCMSSADRAEEVEQKKQAYIRGFNNEGKIPGFDDEPADRKAFDERYLNTQEKHNLDKIATGISASSDVETRALLLLGESGLAADRETPDEKKTSEIGRGMRKGQFDGNVPIDKYLDPTKENTYQRLNLLVPTEGPTIKVDSKKEANKTPPEPEVALKYQKSSQYGNKEKADLTKDKEDNNSLRPR